MFQEVLELQNVVTSPLPPVYSTYAVKEDVIPPPRGGDDGGVQGNRGSGFLALPSESPDLRRLTMSSSVCSKLDLIGQNE